MQKKNENTYEALNFTVNLFIERISSITNTFALHLIMLMYFHKINNVPIYVIHIENKKYDLNYIRNIQRIATINR